jgi:hypothetical protein
MPLVAWPLLLPAGNRPGRQGHARRARINLRSALGGAAAAAAAPGGRSPGAREGR